MEFATLRKTQYIQRIGRRKLNNEDVKFYANLKYYSIYLTVILYGSYDTEDEVKLPDSFIEMKASEFYKLIESLEEN